MLYLQLIQLGMSLLLTIYGFLEMMTAYESRSDDNTDRDESMLTSEIFPSKKFVQSEIRVREIEYTVQSFSISSSNISSSATAMISGHKERLGGGQRMAGRIREAGRSSA